MSDGDVLVICVEHCPRQPVAGPWTLALDNEQHKGEGCWPDKYLWLPRAQAEHDQRYLQVIPYALIVNPAGDVWCYRRVAGDTRLRERFSCGVGGHIEPIDEGPNFATTAQRALRRELAEELGWRNNAPTSLRACAWIYEGLSAIGRVHLGLVFRVPWSADEEPKPLEGDSMAATGFWSTARILQDERFELWSRLSARFLIASQAKT